MGRLPQRLHRRHALGAVRLRLVVRRCVNRDCELYHERRRPEQEGAFALPQGEFGLDVIALIGALRHAEHRSVPEIHRELSGRGVALSERTVTNLLERYEELVALRISDRVSLRHRLKQQRRALLSMDGLQPDVGHEVLWVVRECLSGRCFWHEACWAAPKRTSCLCCGKWRMRWRCRSRASSLTGSTPSARPW